MGPVVDDLGDPGAEARGLRYRRPDGDGHAYWDEDDARARYDALSDACCIYGYRELEQNLRRHGARRARRKVLAHGALSGGWVWKGGGEVRLTRRGLEMRFRSGTRLLRWKQMREMILARGS